MGQDEVGVVLQAERNVCPGWRIPGGAFCRDVCALSGAALEIPPIGRLMDGPEASSANRREGFSLLEMMILVTLILIVVSIATPVYRICVVRARETVLRDHLFGAVSPQPSAFSAHADN